MTVEYNFKKEPWAPYKLVLSETREEMAEIATEWGIKNSSPEVKGHVQEFIKNETNEHIVVVFLNLIDMKNDILDLFEIVYHEALHVALALYRIRFDRADFSDGPSQDENNPEETICYLQGSVAAGIIASLKEELAREPITPQ